jgi:hypothetical protein
MKDYFKGLVLPGITVLVAMLTFFMFRVIDTYEAQTEAIIRALNGNCKVGLEKQGYKVLPPAVEEEN